MISWPQQLAPENNVEDTHSKFVRAVRRELVKQRFAKSIKAADRYIRHHSLDEASRAVGVVDPDAGAR